MVLLVVVRTLRSGWKKRLLFWLRFVPCRCNKGRLNSAIGVGGSSRFFNDMWTNVAAMLLCQRERIMRFCNPLAQFRFNKVPRDMKAEDRQFLGCRGCGVTKIPFRPHVVEKTFHFSLSLLIVFFFLSENFRHLRETKNPIGPIFTCLSLISTFLSSSGRKGFQMVSTF